MQVTCLDLAVEPLSEASVRAADLVAMYLPMHTATRLAVPVIRRVRELNQQTHVCCYGLYAPANESFLRAVGADTILGGEFEQGLVALVDRLSAGGPVAAVQPEPIVSVAKQSFIVPHREGLPSLSQYAKLIMPN